MGVEAFERWLEQGLGRAHLVLRRENPAPYRAALLRASVESRTYYTVERGDRAEYLF